MAAVEELNDSVWPGLTVARDEAAQRGSTSIGTQHVLLALLHGPDGDALRALRAGGVDPGSAASALDRVIGIGGRPGSISAGSVSVSPRALRLLEHAAQYGGHPVQDSDVLRALLTSDDPAVGQLVVTILSSPGRVLEALDEDRGNDLAPGLGDR